MLRQISMCFFIIICTNLVTIWNLIELTLWWKWPWTSDDLQTRPWQSLYARRRWLTEGSRFPRYSLKWEWGNPWWHRQMEIFSALLATCAGNSPVTGEFPTQRPVTRSFDVFFDLRLNKRLSKKSWGWWFESPSRILWRHSNAMAMCKTAVTPC